MQFEDAQALAVKRYE